MNALNFSDCLSIISKLDQLTVKDLALLLINPVKWEKDFDELVYHFILQVIYEQKLHPDGKGIGSATKTKFIYRELLYSRYDLDREFVLDLGDWAAVYNKNPYCPMDNHRGYTVREYLDFSCELIARIAEEKEDSLKRKEEIKKQAQIKHLERISKNKANYRHTILHAICNRLDIKQFNDRKISEDVVARLKTKIKELKRKSGLNIKLHLNQPDIFKDLVLDDSFSGVSNFIVISGKDCNCDYEKSGYFGEQLVLLAQILGLNASWVELIRPNNNYSKKEDFESLITGIIAIGYGNISSEKKLCESISQKDWFEAGLEAISFAPVLDEEQQFSFRLFLSDNDKAEVVVDKNFDESQYLQMVSLGIAKLHFEIGADKKNFKWQENSLCKS